MAANTSTKARALLGARLALCAAIAAGVVFIADRLLAGRWWPVFPALQRFATEVGGTVAGLVDVVGGGQFLVTHSWRPFLIVTGCGALFGMLALRHLPPGRVRVLIDYGSAACGFLFAVAGTLYGLFKLTGSWHAAQLCAAVLVLFFIGALTKRR
jgi:hypothetical protein